MKCSMMFRRMTAVAGILLMLLTGGVTVHAESETDTGVPDGNGNFLIVYSDRYEESVENTVETMVTMAAAMGKTADYGTVSECIPVLDQYEYVICCDLREEEESFCQKLMDYQGKIMVLGSSFMKQYLKLYGYRSSWYEEEGSVTRGELRYSFLEGTPYSGIVKLDGMLSFLYTGYSSGEILIGSRSIPFCSQAAEVRFIPVTEYESEVAKAALIRELSEWLWPYKDSPPDYAQYLVLDELYPFMNCSELKRQIDTIIEAAVPFTLSVMPVWQNVDYPSMKEFCQVLAYAQNNGGTVILHAPIIHKTVDDIEEIYEKLTDMTMAYVNQGVYPMGIQVPGSWLNDELYLKVLERYRTVFVYDDGKETGFSMETGTSRFARQGHQTVMPSIGLGKMGETSLKCYSSAVYISGATNEAELAAILDNSRVSQAPFMNLWDLDHSVWINDYNIAYTDGLLFLNGEYTEMVFEQKEYEEDYDYQRRMIQRITVNLQNQNHFLMGVVVVVIIIFASFIIFARVRNRKQFLHKEKEE